MPPLDPPPRPPPGGRAPVYTTPDRVVGNHQRATGPNNALCVLYFFAKLDYLLLVHTRGACALRVH